MLNPDMPDQELRLHMGELSAQEMRAARAAIRWANSVAGREVERLERENGALAAWQCIFHDGSGLTGDEYGNSVCLKHNLLRGMGVVR